jgi:hypothetical protein
MLVSSSDHSDCEGFLTIPWWRAKRYSSGMRVACVILSCVSCAAPYWGFGVWCQLAHEPPSECIVTTRTSLPASKWTSVKNHCVIFDSKVIGLYWYSLLWLGDFICDWLNPLHNGIIFHHILYLTLFSCSCVALLLIFSLSPRSN